MSNSVGVTPLGQVGYRLDFAGVVIYIDPYLSNSVQEKDSADLARLLPIPFPPDSITDADFVFITHGHLDHCDPDTLAPIAAASPECIFVAPTSVRDILRSCKIDERRMRSCSRHNILDLGSGISASATPAAHPLIELDGQGDWTCVGYVFQWRGGRIYHAGDTALCDEMIEHLRGVGKIDFAFLPVNETNYFRSRRGIVGNLSIREAFGLAEELEIDCVIPTHWDMFAANQVFSEEIELLYDRLSPPFRLQLNPSSLRFGE